MSTFRRAGPRLAAFVGAAMALAMVAATAADTARPWARDLDRLVKAYPDFLDRVDGNDLVWKDGERMPIDDGKGEKGFEARLASPDIADQFWTPYSMGRAGTPPALNADPGRVRYAPLFEKMYGSCTGPNARVRLVDVAWLPRHGRQRLKVTPVNGVAKKLEAVSRELATLPAKFLGFLKPSAGAYNCRVIAGTGRASAHGYGIAIDISLAHADYWRWSKPGPGAIAYKNRIPWEIVDIFEKHGFIWGGKWYHYDTMHFEYRPELMAR